MKLPMETVMKLPVQDRRYYIQRHNGEQEEIRARTEKRNGTTVDGEAINEYARMEQNLNETMRRG